MNVRAKLKRSRSLGCAVSLLGIGLLSVMPVGGVLAQSAQSATLTPSPTQLSAFKACVETAIKANARLLCETPVFYQCIQAYPSPDSTLAISECTMVVNAAWDHMLNAIYAATLAEQSPASRIAIRNAQRRWITSRKADCDAVYQVNIGGSIRTVVFTDCMANATRTRYEWLKNLAMQEN
jgi:uncharacterized protein YecT (DUF1311 family)